MSTTPTPRNGRRTAASTGSGGAVVSSAALAACIGCTLLCVGLFGAIIVGAHATSASTACFPSPQPLLATDGGYANASAVALSCHGQTLVVGQSLDGDVTGRALVYVRTDAPNDGNVAAVYSANSTIERPPSIVEPPIAGFASVLAIDRSGAVVVVGERRPPTAFVYRRRPTNGTYALAQTLVVLGATSERFAAALAMSADSRVVVVGDPGANRVHVYTLADGTVEPTYGPRQRIEGAAESDFGASVALSGDGAWLAVGAPATDEDSGAVSLYALNVSASDTYTLVDTWTTARTQTSATARLGGAVALDDGGTTLVMGAADHDGGSTLPRSGAVAVGDLSLMPGSLQQLLLGSRQHARFGASVAVSAGDGARSLAVGSWSDGEVAGGAVVLQRASSAARYNASLAQEAGGRSNARGRAVALADDAATVAVTQTRSADDTPVAATADCLRATSPTSACKASSPTLPSASATAAAAAAVAAARRPGGEHARLDRWRRTRTV